jgi:hypothetical protein
MPTIISKINNFTFINIAFIPSIKHWPYTTTKSPQLLLLHPIEDRIENKERKLRKHKNKTESYVWTVFIL